jgi:hypothetical protein
MDPVAVTVRRLVRKARMKSAEVLCRGLATVTGDTVPHVRPTSPATTMASSAMSKGLARWAW